MSCIAAGLSSDGIPITVVNLLGATPSIRTPPASARRASVRDPRNTGI